MMLIILLVTILLLLVTYVYLRWIRLKQFWAERQVPHLPPHPLFGSLTFLGGENPVAWYRNVYKHFKTPYVGLWIFWRPGLLVHSEEIAQKILVKDQANFRNRFATSGTTDPVGRFNLFTVNDPLWSLLSKHLSMFFTGAKLSGIQDLIRSKSMELVERIDRDRQKKEPINLRAVMADFSTDIIGSSSLGVGSDATLNGKSQIRIITEDYMTYGLFRTFSWLSIFLIPELVDIFRFKMFSVEITEYMRKILRKMIVQRGGFEKKIKEPRDLLDILIKIKQEDDGVLNMTEDMMLAQVAIFIMAGFETSSITLTFGFYELAFCFEAQDKLYRELQEAKDKHGDNILNATVLSQLTYLNCVINEVFRKYPPLPVLDRVALEDYKVDDKLTIQAGTPVFVNVSGLHHDPDIYPEPDRFNPDRFLPENESDVKHFAFFPFGKGPRKCIGQRLGQSSLRHAMAAVILNYEIKPLPNSPKPSEVNLDKKRMYSAPRDILSVEFVPRN